MYYVAWCVHVVFDSTATCVSTMFEENKQHKLHVFLDMAVLYLEHALIPDALKHWNACIYYFSLILMCSCRDITTMECLVLVHRVLTMQ